MSRTARRRPGSRSPGSDASAPARADEEGGAATGSPITPAVEELARTPGARRRGRCRARSRRGARGARASPAAPRPRRRSTPSGFPIDVLAGREDVAAHRDMGVGDRSGSTRSRCRGRRAARQGWRRNAELRPAPPRPRRIEVGNRARSRIGKLSRGREVGAADVAAADDPDTDAFCPAAPISPWPAGATATAPPGDLEATTGIEPVCTDLQSAASPLRHVAPQDHPI